MLVEGRPGESGLWVSEYWDLNMAVRGDSLPNNFEVKGMGLLLGVGL